MEPAEPSDIALWPNEVGAFLRAGAVFLAALFVAGVAYRAGGEAPAALVLVGGGAFSWAGLMGSVRRPRLTIGSDGIAVAGRFFPFAEVDDVEIDETPYGRTHHLAWLRLRSGERLRLGGRLGLLGHTALAKVDEAYEDLRRRIAAHRSLPPAQHAAELARGQKPVRTWLDDVRARAASAGFRDGAIARSDLLAVVEDPTADPTARTGAALALKKDIAAAERARIRVAATASAAPKVRVALEAVADDASTDERASAAVARVGQ